MVNDYWSTEEGKAALALFRRRKQDILNVRSAIAADFPNFNMKNADSMIEAGELGFALEFMLSNQPKILSRNIQSVRCLIENLAIEMDMEADNEFVDTKTFRQKFPVDIS